MEEMLTQELDIKPQNPSNAMPLEISAHTLCLILPTHLCSQVGQQAQKLQLLILLT